MLKGMRHAAASALAAAMVLVVATAPCMGASPGAAEWNQPHKPFRIYGNVYYVGTQGLSAILLTSDYGHVLIDAGLPESAPLIKANIEALGFKLTEVKAILNSHVHPDHAGGIAALQRESGAQVYAMRAAEPVLRTGKLTADDPQFAAKAAGIDPVPQVWVVQDDQLLGIGALRLRAIATPGHTPGGTSWAWESCEGGKCLNFFHADSLSAVSAAQYRFKDHPGVLQDFERSFRRVETAACDVLLTPHPEASQLFQRLDPAAGTRAESIRDVTSCQRYAQAARETLSRRLAGEN